MGTWVQPKLTSDTSYGTVSCLITKQQTGEDGAAILPAYYAVDGNTATWWQLGRQPGTTTPLQAGWWNWEFPETIRVKGISILNRTTARPNITVQCYTDSTKSTPIGSAVTATALNTTLVVPNIPASGIDTDNIYLYCTSTEPWLGITEITIDADIAPTAVSGQIDVCVDVAGAQNGNSDVRCSQATPGSGHLDGARAILWKHTGQSDVSFSLQQVEGANTDIQYGLSKDAIAERGPLDMERSLRETIHGAFDFQRCILVGQGAQNDSFREIVNTGIAHTANVDLARSRRTVQTRKIDITLSAALGYSGHGDSTRRLVFQAIVDHDTIRRIPYSLNNATAGILSLTLNLQERTLSDTFAVETAQPLTVSDSLSGSILDFSYHYLVEETSQQGLIISAKGMYDVDQLLYTPFTYKVPASASAATHAEKIAAGLGKSLQAYFEDFTPTSTFASAGATYQNIISGIFGWTDKLPQRSINVCIRNETLYVIQRGMEPHTIDLTPLVAAHAISQPSIDSKLLRSVWFAPAGDNSGNATDAATEQDAEKNPFTGTITFGDQSCSYAQGLLTSEIHGSEETTYSYASYDGENMYLSEKRKETTEEMVTTEFSYSVLPHDLYLAMETETTVNKQHTDDRSVRITRHYPVGNGWYGTTVEVDGMYQGSNLAQGKPGNKVNRYSVDQANTSLDNRKETSDSTSKIQGRALFDTEFPVRGTQLLRELTKAIEWLDRKVQETVSFDIWGYDHVIDFTDALQYHGATYYLVSNTITQTPRELKQSITMVRWY